MIKASPPLDLNSRYLYFVVADHFSDTSVVAEKEGEIVGFVSAYLVPERPECLFIWQVAVRGDQRGQGLAVGMLEELLARPECEGVTKLETTITPSNKGSDALFRSIAEKLGANVRTSTYLDVDHFGGDAHEPEVLYEIEPINR